MEKLPGDLLLKQRSLNILKEKNDKSGNVSRGKGENASQMTPTPTFNQQNSASPKLTNNSISTSFGRGISHNNYNFGQFEGNNNNNNSSPNNNQNRSNYSQEFNDPIDNLVDPLTKEELYVYMMVNKLLPPIIPPGAVDNPASTNIFSQKQNSNSSLSSESNVITVSTILEMYQHYQYLHALRNDAQDRIYTTLAQYTKTNLLDFSSQSSHPPNSIYHQSQIDQTEEGVSGGVVKTQYKPSTVKTIFGWFKKISPFSTQKSDSAQHRTKSALQQRYHKAQTSSYWENNLKSSCAYINPLTGDGSKNSSSLTAQMAPNSKNVPQLSSSQHTMSPTNEMKVVEIMVDLLGIDKSVVLVDLDNQVMRYMIGTITFFPHFIKTNLMKTVQNARNYVFHTISLISRHYYNSTQSLLLEPHRNNVNNRNNYGKHGNNNNNNGANIYQQKIHQQNNLRTQHRNSIQISRRPSIIESALASTFGSTQQSNRSKLSMVNVLGHPDSYVPPTPHFGSMSGHNVAGTFNFYSKNRNLGLPTPKNANPSQKSTRGHKNPFDFGQIDRFKPPRIDEDEQKSDIGELGDDDLQQSPSSPANRQFSLEEIEDHIFDQICNIRLKTRYFHNKFLYSAVPVNVNDPTYPAQFNSISTSVRNSFLLTFSSLIGHYVLFWDASHSSTQPHTGLGSSYQGDVSQGVFNCFEAKNAYSPTIPYTISSTHSTKSNPYSPNNPHRAQDIIFTKENTNIFINPQFGLFEQQNQGQNQHFSHLVDQNPSLSAPKSPPLVQIPAVYPSLLPQPAVTPYSPQQWFQNINFDLPSFIAHIPPTIVHQTSTSHAGSASLSQFLTVFSTSLMFKNFLLVRHRLKGLPVIFYPFDQLCVLQQHNLAFDKILKLRQANFVSIGWVKKCPITTELSPSLATMANVNNTNSTVSIGSGNGFGSSTLSGSSREVLVHSTEELNGTGNGHNSANANSLTTSIDSGSGIAGRILPSLYQTKVRTAWKKRVIKLFGCRLLVYNNSVNDLYGILHHHGNNYYKNTHDEQFGVQLEHNVNLLDMLSSGQGFNQNHLRSLVHHDVHQPKGLQQYRLSGLNKRLLHADTLIPKYDRLLLSHLIHSRDLSQYSNALSPTPLLNPPQGANINDGVNNETLYYISSFVTHNMTNTVSHDELNSLHLTDYDYSAGNLVNSDVYKDGTTQQGLQNNPLATTKSLKPYTNFTRAPTLGNTRSLTNLSTRHTVSEHGVVLSTGTLTTKKQNQLINSDYFSPINQRLIPIQTSSQMENPYTYFQNTSHINAKAPILLFSLYTDKARQLILNHHNLTTYQQSASNSMLTDTNNYYAAAMTGQNGYHRPRVSDFKVLTPAHTYPIPYLISILQKQYNITNLDPIYYVGSQASKKDQKEKDKKNEPYFFENLFHSGSMSKTSLQEQSIYNSHLAQYYSHLSQVNYPLTKGILDAIYILPQLTKSTTTLTHTKEHIKYNNIGQNGLNNDKNVSNQNKKLPGKEQISPHLSPHPAHPAHTTHPTQSPLIEMAQMGNNGANVVNNNLNNVPPTVPSGLNGADNNTDPTHKPPKPQFSTGSFYTPFSTVGTHLSSSLAASTVSPQLLGQSQYHIVDQYNNSSALLGNGQTYQQQKQQQKQQLHAQNLSLSHYKAPPLSLSATAVNGEFIGPSHYNNSPNSNDNSGVREEKTAVGLRSNDVSRFSHLNAHNMWNYGLLIKFDNFERRQMFLSMLYAKLIDNDLFQRYKQFF
jgi:hypothetical protein